MREKSQDSVHKPQPFSRERRTEADSSRGPSAYQPKALPLGQTGSRQNRFSFFFLTSKSSSLLCRGVPDYRIIFHRLKELSGYRTIDRLEERGVDRRSGRRSSLKGWERAIVNQTKVGTVSKATLGQFSSKRDRARIDFSEPMDTNASPSWKARIAEIRVIIIYGLKYLKGLEPATFRSRVRRSNTELFTLLTGTEGFPSFESI